MNQKMSSMPAALIRLLVGWVFLAEGILKYLWIDDLGVGRFATIGIPAPHFTAPFVGLVEMVCGALVIVGLFTRLAAVPLLIDISVAILSTKIPILLGHDFWIFHVAKFPRYGFWSMAHEARADLCMLLGALYLLIEGGGKWSLDAWLSRSRPPTPA